MNKYIMSCGALLWLACATVASAETGACSHADITKVYFVNGVWNSPLQARSGMTLLKRAYKQELEQQYTDQVFEFVLAYNFSAGKVRDLIEVIGQKLNEIDDLDADRLTPTQYYTLYMTAQSFNASVPQSAKPLTTTIEEYFAARLTETVTATSHIQKYRTDLQEGRRVLLIAHSQGNLFANQAIAELMNNYGGSIGMIGVASPAATTHNGSTYYTAHDDRVIDVLRATHMVLPSNIDNDPGFLNDPRDFSNHKFKESYFEEGIPSRTLIDEDVARHMSDLQFPAPELGSGAMTVTLTWGSEFDSQPDVDLHVTEPNGTHVYYVNPFGPSGYLDLDDMDGFGPEHYYVSCDTLETGSYHIGVNYFSGNGPETAQIQVTTDDGNTRTYQQPLGETMGSSGNDDPIHISTVTVRAEQNGDYVYEVE